MVSTQISLGIAAVDELDLVTLTPAIRAANSQYVKDRNWLQLFRTTQHATDVAMCDRAHQLAVADRKVHPNGGVLLVANDQSHVARLVELMSSAARQPSVGKVGIFEDMSDSSFGCVIVSKGKDRGYNAGTRLGAMVKGAYPGNGASRHQMRGRNPPDWANADESDLLHVRDGATQCCSC